MKELTEEVCFEPDAHSPFHIHFHEKRKPKYAMKLVRKY